MVYHLKPDEVIRIGGRRVALSIARDPSSVPPIRSLPQGAMQAYEARMNGTPHPRPAPHAAPITPADRIIAARPRSQPPVFLVIEVQAGEDVVVGGLRLTWDNIRQRKKGVSPALVIDGAKETYPVEKTVEKYRLDRPGIVGVLP